MNSRSFRRALVPDLREQVRVATARAILDAAEEVFAADGVHGAHMGEIARKAGLAVGTLYNHFRDRETLLSALIEANSQELFRAMDEVLDQKRPFAEQLSELLGAVLGHLERHRKFFRILLRGDLGDLKVKLLGKTTDRTVVMTEIVRRFALLIRRGVREKILRADADDHFALFLVGMVKAMSMRDVIQPDKGAPTQVDEMVRFFLHGAAPR